MGKLWLHHVIFKQIKQALKLGVWFPSKDRSAHSGTGSCSSRNYSHKQKDQNRFYP